MGGATLSFARRGVTHVTSFFRTMPSRMIDTRPPWIFIDNVVDRITSIYSTCLSANMTLKAYRGAGGVGKMKKQPSQERVDTLMRMVEEKADVGEVTDHLLDIQRSLTAKADRAEKNKVRAWRQAWTDTALAV